MLEEGEIEERLGVQEMVLPACRSRSALWNELNCKWRRPSLEAPIVLFALILFSRRKICAAKGDAHLEQRFDTKVVQVGNVQLSTTRGRNTVAHYSTVPKMLERQ